MKIEKFKNFDEETFIDEINIYLMDFDLKATFLRGYSMFNVYIISINKDTFNINDDLIAEFYHIIDHFVNLDHKLEKVAYTPERPYDPMTIYDTKQNRWGRYQQIDSIWDIQGLDWKERPIVMLVLTFEK